MADEFPETDEELTSPEEALKFLNDAFEGQNFEFLAEGSSAFIFKNDKGQVFKVIRDHENSGYIEDEVAKLAFLGRKGITPELDVFYDIDPSKKHYREDKGRDFIERDTYVTKSEKTLAFSVIVMEEVPNYDRYYMPNRKRLEAFDKFMAFQTEYNVVMHDVEVVADSKTDDAVIIDIGGLDKHEARFRYAKSSNIQIDLFEGLTADEVFLVNALFWTEHHLAINFNKTDQAFSRQKIAEEIRTGNLSLLIHNMRDALNKK